MALWVICVKSSMKLCVCVWNCRDQNDGQAIFWRSRGRKKNQCLCLWVLQLRYLSNRLTRMKQLPLSSTFQAHQRRMVRRVGPVTLIILYQLATGTEKSLVSMRKSSSYRRMAANKYRRNDRTRKITMWCFYLQTFSMSSFVSFH